MVDKISCSGPAGCRRERRVAIVAACTVLLFTEMTAEEAWAGALLPERGGSPNADRDRVAVHGRAGARRAGVLRRGGGARLRVAALRRAAQPGRGADTGEHIAWRSAGRLAASRVDRGAGRLLADQAARDRPPRPRRGQSSRHPRRRRARRSRPAVAHRRRGPAVHLEVPLSRRRLLLRGDGRTGRCDGRAGHHLARRRALVVDPEAGRQVRRDPRLRQPHVVPAAAARGLPRPVRRAVRSQPRGHARAGPRRCPRPSTSRGWPSRSSRSRPPTRRPSHRRSPPRVG